VAYHTPSHPIFEPSNDVPVATNPKTNFLSIMGPVSDDGSFTISIPEPGSSLLAGLGALVIASFTRRRK